jgi:hypothetical protein
MPQEVRVPRPNPRQEEIDRQVMELEKVMTENPLERIADQIKNLKYSDMMEFGRGLVALVKAGPEGQIGPTLTTPESYAALLHSWATVSKAPLRDSRIHGTVIDGSGGGASR